MSIPSSSGPPRLPRPERVRIAQAKEEAGATAVAPPVARLLVAVFLLVISAPPVAQSILNPGFFRDVGTGSAAAGTAPAPDSIVARVRAANRGLAARARGIEDRLADDSVLGRRVRPVVQGALTRWLGAGTAQVEVGVDGWLFYRPDIDHVTGPGFLSAGALARRAAEGDTLAAARQPDPRPALVDLHERLERRGIRLIVVPTPVKPSADPRRVGAGGFDSEPVMNRSYRRYVRELERAGVTVFDVSRTLSALRREGAGPLYLATDTHWRPETMRRVASELAAFIEREAAFSAPIEREAALSAPAGGYRARRVEVTGRGDTARLLGLAPRRSRYRSETVSVTRIETPEGEAWAPERSAEVLLLGDSFTNVYSLASLGWGASAGFAEQLGFALGRPVDRISQNDGGAFVPRRLLALEVARDARRLAATRVVAYQFAARELSQGDWRPIAPGMEAEAGEGGAAIRAPGIDAADGRSASPSVRPGGDAFRAPGVDAAGGSADRAAPPPGGDAFWAPGIDSTAVVEATVAATGPIPRPGSVPYRDHVVAFHLTEIDVLAGPAAGAVPGAVVYVRSMIDNELTVAAGYRAGDRVRLALESWAGVARELDGVSRGELADPALLRAVPWWGTPAGSQP